MRISAFALVYLIVNYGIYAFNADTLANPILFYILSAVIGIVFFMLFLFVKTQNYTIRKCFTPVAAVLGILYMTVTPALRTADEELHFYRAYEISMGYPYSQLQGNVGGRALPKSLVDASPENTLEFNFKNMRRKIHIPLNKDETVFVPFTTAALYAPLQYLPQAAGILLGRALGFGPIMLVYCGRLLNLLTWLIICRKALKNLRWQPAAMLLMLLPMTLHTVASLSPDALTNSLIFLFISYTVRISYFDAPAQLTRYQMILIGLMAVGIALCKIVYLPLCLLVFILPQEKFVNKKQRIAYCLGLIFTCSAINLLWLSHASRYLVEVSAGVNAMEQLHFILTHPLRYLFILARTTAHYTNVYIHSLIGANLCLFDVPIYYWISNGYLFMLFFAFGFAPKLPLRQRDSRLALGIFVTVFLLINTSLYIQWTSVARNIIDGMQGRYFLPLMPLWFFLPYRLKEKSMLKPVMVSSILLSYPVVITLLLKHI